MHVEPLIDTILRQTAMLVAEVSTTAGTRASLARIGDRLFFELSRELESRGLPRKVVADILGFSLSAYQRKVRRLERLKNRREGTLWCEVHEYLKRAPCVSRRELLEHFSAADPEALGSVLGDLVSSGLVNRRGSGANMEYSISGNGEDRLGSVSSSGWETRAGDAFRAACAAIVDGVPRPTEVERDRAANDGN